jgi:hypothetical protein
MVSRKERKGIFIKRTLGVARYAVAWIVIGGLIGGCGGGSDSETTVFSEESVGPSDGLPSASSLVLDEMPEGEVTTPTDIKSLGGDETFTVLAGRIDAGDMDPFQPNEVAFMISQLPDEVHAGDDPDHADNCPFCKHKMENAPKAIVQFRGADGNLLPGDPRKTLSLEKGDVVYVTGTAQYNPAVNTVIVNASGVFRKPDR